MKSVNVLVCGAAAVGKTQLVQRMLGERFIEQYVETMGAAYSSFKEGDIHLVISDTAGGERYRALRALYIRPSIIILYCIDLSKPVDKSRITTDLEQINKTKQEGTTLILVGTKSDLPPQAGLTEIDAQFPGVFVCCIATSAQNNTALEELKSALFLLANPQKIAARALKDELSRLSYEVKSSKLNENKKARILGYINELESKRKHVDFHLTAVDDVNQFTKRCAHVLNGQYPPLMKSIMAFAALVIVTTLAGLIGFGIGFAAGAWSGFGAFFTGFAAGTAAAKAVVAVSISSGVLSSGALAYRFFNSPKGCAQIRNRLAEVKDSASDYIPKKYESA